MSKMGGKFKKSAGFSASVGSGKMGKKMKGKTMLSSPLVKGDKTAK